MALWYCDSQRPSEQRAFCHDIILRNLVWSLKQIYDPGTHRESTWLTNLPAYETDFFFKKGQLGLATHRRRSASLKSSVERCSCMARASIIGNLPPLWRTNMRLQHCKCKCSSWEKKYGEGQQSSQG